jgi:hypothetical protein
MAEIDIYKYKHNEVVEALIKHEGIHEGFWGIVIEFGIQGANIGSSPESEDLMPAAIVPVLKIGIQRVDKITSLSVDAAKVNPG